ncbi:TRAP transporter substrate-binding protein [Bradyrhizobium sp. CCBAU 53338]|uniref:TRAP transporter substrate-binding protein n=1 Tax=Bradyrhizobium sp. CCBAU 53338 TaxID=1325111 RepID=UPI00188B9E96|nr:TRAP transporter substrate-binding protein [Bradyrhizobium sp. CCBAU 53338]QOZ52721.1 ABC transporter substrate-binding protein [Bradyrhizobium sp. CCBAU 53338]
MTKFSRRTMLTGIAGGLVAPSLIRRAAAATTLKISTSFPNDPKFSTARIWYDLFLPRLKEATDGQIATQFFPDNQLGQEADVVNQVKSGVVDMMLVGTSIWTNIVPEIGAFDLGYIFQDFDHMRRVAASPAGEAVRQLLVQKASVHFPAWGRNLGARNFMTKFAFKTPAELAGKKIRCLPNPVVTETVKLMGAAATPMAFGEIYTGLQAGVIDGLEHDAPTVLSAKFYETAKNFTLTKHIHTPFGAFISDRTMTKLPAAQRDGLLKAIKEATDDQFAKASQIEADAMAELAKLGVTVAECDRAAFRERVRPMWDRFVERTPGAKPLLDAIQQTANG